MPDDFDPVVADRFTVLDQIPVPDTWVRAQSTAHNHPSIQFTEEETTMIDLETPSPTAERRKGPKRALAAALLAAAAVIAIALVVIGQDDPVAPAAQPPVVATAVPTVPPRALFGTEAEQFAPGTYYVDEFEGSTTPRVFVAVSRGWVNTMDNWAIRNETVGAMTFGRPDRVLSSACDATEGYHRGPVTTLDGLVSALTEQGGWAQISEPIDITVNGYQGKEFERRAPDDITGCNGGGNDAFRSWENGSTSRPDWSYYEAGEIETVRVLDLDGTVVTINTRLKPDHPEAAAVAELAAMLDSIHIEHT